MRDITKIRPDGTLQGIDATITLHRPLMEDGALCDTREEAFWNDEARDYSKVILIEEGYFRDKNTLWNRHSLVLVWTGVKWCPFEATLEMIEQNDLSSAEIDEASRDLRESRATEFRG